MSSILLPRRSLWTPRLSMPLWLNATAYGIRNRRSASARKISATGGIVTNSGGYTIHKFNLSGTLVVSGRGNVEYLVIGGGGPGRGNGNPENSGDGGDAGEFKTGILTVNNGTYNVVVGIGGTGIAGEIGNTGGNSSIFSIISNGGLSGQGNSSAVARKGGDGAGDVGQGPFFNANGGLAGNGGPGLSSNISGTAITYAGGGGGGFTVGGLGGIGGGGRGQSFNSTAAQPGIVNTGSGGGGVSSTGVNPGKDGGSGIVIVRYLT